jgi:DNA-binding GntR family transcriptional regulator
MASPTVVNRLRELILGGEYEAGERLNQAALAGRLGVSRIPVRDALQMLAAEGLVELNGRAGATVADVSISDLQEIYDMVEAIEPLACKLAVTNIGRVQILQMERLQEIMEETDDDETWLEANHQFHALLYRASNRERMITLIDNLRVQKDRYMRAYKAGLGDVDQLHEEHRKMLEAIRAGDAQAVSEWARRHLVTSHDVLLHHMLGANAGAGSQ